MNEERTGIPWHCPVSLAVLLAQSMEFLWWPLQFIFENKTQATADHQGPNSCSSSYILKLFFVICFLLGLLCGNTMCKHLTALPQVPWLWELFYWHEALKTEIHGYWKSWFPFSVGRVVVEHCDVTLGLTGAVTWGWPQPFPAGGWWWKNGHTLIPQQWFFYFFFIMLNIFSNKIGSRLENPYWEEKYWSSKHRKFSEESECHLCAVKTQRALYNLLSALCLGSHCIIHAHKFGTQLVPLSKTQSSNAC